MKFFRLLLWLLPRDFRKDHSDELLQTVSDLWHEEKAVPSPVRWLFFWFRQAFSVLRASLVLRWKRGILGGADRLAADQRTISLTGLWQDLQFASRSLRARPGFTLAAIFTLSLGVGATTAMFSVVHSILLRDLPYKSAEQVAVIKQAQDGLTLEGISAANLRDVSDQTQTLSAAAVANPYGFTMLEEGRAISLRSWKVSAGFFEAIGGHVMFGRTFLPEEYEDGQDKVVILSFQSWGKRFGRDPNILGRTLVLDDEAYAVVGVMEENFRFPSDSELWAPRPPQTWDSDYRSAPRMLSVARLSPGSTWVQAQAELDVIAALLAEDHPQANAGMGLRLIPLRQHLFGDIASPLRLLLGAVALVLLIAAANVAGLQLARGTGRAREYALRGALGASSGRILRLASLENLLLAGLGGVMGIAHAQIGIEWIRWLGPNHLPRLDEVRLDNTALIFALVAAIGSSLLAGMVPALRASKLDLNTALIGLGSRSHTPGASTSRFKDRLVIAEIALALVLAIGAGLLIRSYDRLLDNDLGFIPKGRLALQVFAYDENDQPDVEFLERSVEEIAALSGVEVVGVTTNLPAADNRSIYSANRSTSWNFVGQAPPNTGEEYSASIVSINEAYPEALGLALRAGRIFSSQDHSKSASVALVNETFARRYLDGQDAVGRRILLGQNTRESREIVGVLADVRPSGFESEPRPEIYLPLRQNPSGALTFVIQSGIDPGAQLKAVHEAIWSVKPEQAIWAALPMNDLLQDWVRLRRFNTALLLSFAFLALSLAAIGVYGLISFSVEQRIEELGIRRALGGQASDILAMVLKRGLSLALSGTAVGLVGAAVVARLLQGMLYGIAALDPLTFTTLSALVIGIALLATWVPARRAMRVDPMTVLRAE